VFVRVLGSCLSARSRRLLFCTTSVCKMTSRLEACATVVNSVVPMHIKYRTDMFECV
jgi:hypothetical protein